ncbi:MAG: hypothetical protein KH054_06175 [Firmicutes bacterium]|nr:hypothetical protein [Bacillota bacterium]
MRRRYSSIGKLFPVSSINVFSTSSLSKGCPAASRMETAIFASSSGRELLTLTPMPTTEEEIRLPEKVFSMRIPQIFLSATYTSFGHLMHGTSPNFSTVLHTATEAPAIILKASEAGKFS